MTKKEICTNNKAIAYYSGCGGIEIHLMENEYIYFAAGCWNGKKSYHRAKVYYMTKYDYCFKFHGYTIPLRDCINM